MLQYLLIGAFVKRLLRGGFRRLLRWGFRLVLMGVILWITIYGITHKVPLSPLVATTADNNR